MPRERVRYQTTGGQDRVQLKFSVAPDLAALFDHISETYQTQSAAETFRRLVVDEARRIADARRPSLPTVATVAEEVSDAHS